MTTMRISDLNDDCFVMIFRFISTLDILNIERVNKRLRKAASAYWHHKRSFNLNEVKPIITEAPTLKLRSRVLGVISSFSTRLLRRSPKNIDNKRYTKAVIAVCSRTDRLESITLSISVKLDWQADFALIGELCPNIKSIVFDDKPEHFSQRCPLNISFDSFGGLKELRLPIKLGITSSILNSVPESIEILLGVLGTYDFWTQSEEFTNFFLRHPALKEIKAKRLRLKNDDVVSIFPAIAQFCPKLKKIILYDCSFALDGIELLEGLKVLKLKSANRSLKLSDEQIVAICKRNPNLESLDLSMHSDGPLTIAALEALASLTKLRRLDVWLGKNDDQLNVDEKKRIVHNLLTNSGKSLFRLWIYGWPVTSKTIESMAELCPTLRSLILHITPSSATPDSIRFLVSRIIERPEWNPGDKLKLYVFVKCGGGDEGRAAFAPFEVLNSPGAGLPDGVRLCLVSVH